MPAPLFTPHPPTRRRALIAGVLAAALGFGWALQAQAQERSRADEWRERREARRAEVEPPERGRLERIAYWAEERALAGGGGAPGLYGVAPVLGGIQSGAGLTAGLRWDPTRADPGRLLALEGAYSIRQYWGVRALAGLTSQHGWTGFGFARYRHMPEENFFGLGPATEEASESDYRRDEALVGGLVGKHLGRPGFLGAHVSFQSNRTGPGGDAELPDLDGLSPVPGLYADPDYVIAGAFAEFDTRDVPFFYDYGRRFTPENTLLRGFSLDARRGVYGSVEVATHLNVDGGGADGGYSFTEGRVRLQQFIPIRGGYQGLAFRQAVAYTRPHAGDAVPFFLLPALGGNRSLRGYTQFRFRDRGLVLATAEYRYEVWHFLDLALFVDAGQVFNDADDLGWEHVAASYGIGFRAKAPPQRTIGRFEVARSPEGFRFFVSFGSFF